MKTLKEKKVILLFKQIQKIRIEKGYTQGILGKALKMNKSSYSRAETGISTNFYLRDIFIICKTLKIKPSYLFSLIEDNDISFEDLIIEIKIKKR